MLFYDLSLASVFLLGRRVCLKEQRLPQEAIPSRSLAEDGVDFAWVWASYSESICPYGPTS